MVKIRGICMRSNAGDEPRAKAHRFCESGDRREGSSPRKVDTR
jgi:ribosomal protein L40E